jgi:predicted ribosomally synthesized peptide with SipW-like signal peptide
VKKILFSLVAMVMVIGLAGGAFAYFSDTEQSTGNTFTAGTLDVTLSGTPFNVTNMAPGDIETSTFTVTNAGNLDMLFRAYVSGVTANTLVGAVYFSDILMVKITLRPGGAGTYGPSDLVVYNGPLSGLIGATTSPLNNENAAFDDGWPLNPGFVAVYKIDVELPFATGDAWQAATFTGDLKVDATQFANQTEGSVTY